MNNPKAIHIRAGIAGIAAGLFTGYFMMGPASSITLWAIVAVLLGLTVSAARELWSSLTYGVFLAFSFLLYGFGGDISKLPLYMLFCLTMSLVAIAGGSLMMFLGSLIRKAIV